MKSKLICTFKYLRKAFANTSDNTLILRWAP